jgi:branched-chain amino acid transport system substrate-binding protein
VTARSSRGLLAAALVLAACGGETPVRIGLAGPFGDERGVAMRTAAQLAVAELNAAGGLRGRPVELVLRDDSAGAQSALAAARAFADDRSIVAVVGHLTGSATLAAASTYGGTQPVAVISPSASTPLLADAGPWVFRVCPSDASHGRELADWARNRLGARRAAVLYLNDDDGRGLRDEFVAAFEGQGGAVVTNDPYLDELPGFQPYLERLRRRGGADVLILAGTSAGTGAARIFATMDSLGLSMPVLGGDALAGVERLGAPGRGVYLSAAYLPDQTGGGSFVRAYQEAAGGRLPDQRAAGTYDAVRLVAAAVAAAGTDRERVREWLAGVGTRRPAFDGVTGRIAFDENGDVDKPVTIGVVRDGMLLRAGGP